MCFLPIFPTLCINSMHVNAQEYTVVEVKTWYLAFSFLEGDLMDWILVIMQHTACTPT